MPTTQVCKATYSERNRATVATSDCRAFLAGFPPASAQLAITSPPYNIGKCYERRRSDRDDYLQLQRSTIHETVRVLKDGGSLCWQVGNYADGGGEIMPLDLLFGRLPGANG